MELKSWSNAGPTAGAAFDLVTGATGGEVVVFSSIVHNYGATAAAVQLQVTDSSGTIRGYPLNVTLVAGDHAYMDSKLSVIGTDKVRGLSDSSSVSFLLSGAIVV